MMFDMPVPANENKVHTHRTGYTGNDEWYTPARYIEMAREVMGVIDVDPASNAHAQKTVQAKTYYTAETNGLDKEWHGKVWMNPPYSRALIKSFVAKLLLEFQAGRCSEAIVLTNNSTDTAWFHDMTHNGASICLPRGRIRFEKPDGTLGRTPPQGQVFTYIGGNHDAFKTVYSQIGFVGRIAARPANDNAAARAA